MNKNIIMTALVAISMICDNSCFAQIETSTFVKNNQVIKERSGAKGLNEALKLYGNPVIELNGSYIIWDKGYATDLNGNLKIDVKGQVIDYVFSDYLALTHATNSNNKQSLITDKGDILTKNAGSVEVFNQLIISSKDDVWAAYTTTGNVIVPETVTSKEEFKNLLAQYEGDEPIINNIQLYLNYEYDHQLKVFPNLLVVCGSNSKLGVLDIETGRYIINPTLSDRYECEEAARKVMISFDHVVLPSGDSIEIDKNYLDAMYELWVYSDEEIFCILDEKGSLLYTISSEDAANYRHMNIFQRILFGSQLMTLDKTKTFELKDKYNLKILESNMGNERERTLYVEDGSGKRFLGRNLEPNDDTPNPQAPRRVIIKWGRI